MTGFLVGFVVGAAVVTLVVIIVGPSRQVRRETGMNDEVETRILLGLEPEPDDSEPEPPVELAHRRDYDTTQIKALEDLSKAPKKRKR